MPSFLLQPLVENALKHGGFSARRGGHGEVTGRARREGQRLLLEVSDNGVGLAEPHHVFEGIGLGNTRARLRALYGETQRLELRGGRGGALTTALEIPWRLAEAGEESHRAASADCR